MYAAPSHLLCIISGYESYHRTADMESHPPRCSPRDATANRTFLNESLEVSRDGESDLLSALQGSRVTHTDLRRDNDNLRLEVLFSAS
jgi:hypothetical protein